LLKYRDLRELCDFLGYTSIFMTSLRFTKRIIALIEFKVKSFFKRGGYKIKLFILIWNVDLH